MIPKKKITLTTALPREEAIHLLFPARGVTRYDYLTYPARAEIFDRREPRPDTYPVTAELRDGEI